MLKRICICTIMLVLCFSVNGRATEVSLDEARHVAENWLTHHVNAYGSWAGSQSPEIATTEIMEYEGETVGYNFLVLPRGHLVVPFRNELPVVKLYSETTTLSMRQDSDITHWLKDVELFRIYQKLNEHAEEFAAIDEQTTPNGQLWQLFSHESLPFSQEYASAVEKMEFVSVGPLLQTTWSQGDSYNLQTPLWYTGESTVTGCVATAAAQIMKYWNHPATGQGSTSYIWYNGSTNVTLSQNFGASTYDWANMNNTYSSGSTTTQKNAVAKLMSDVGVAFHMTYGRGADGGSAASTGYGTTVYPTYFNYKSSLNYVYQSSYASDSAWMQVFKAEVQAGRPSQFRASDDEGAGGHSFVVDGYRDSPVEQIHINLGWAGSYDGWYVSNNISTRNYDWNTRQAAVIGIEPNRTSLTSTPLTYLSLLLMKPTTSSGIIGTWIQTYDWGCNGTAGSGNLYIEKNGTWTLQGDQVTITYLSGTTYTGTLSGDTMQGTMVGQTGATGCWSALRSSSSKELETDDVSTTKTEMYDSDGRCLDHKCE